MPRIQPTAAETMRATTNDIARLLDVLMTEIGKHAKRASAAPNNWGFPGNLGKVRSDLIDTVAFISGMGREEIEAFLDDADAAADAN